MVEFKLGNYRVTRWCCTSGMCIVCRAHGDENKRKRVIHTHGVSKEWADHVVKSWPLYGAKAEPMEQAAT